MSEKIITPNKEKKGNTEKRLQALYEFLDWRIQDCRNTLDLITPPYEPDENGKFPDPDTIRALREPTVREMIAFSSAKSELLNLFPELEVILSKHDKNRPISQ